MKRGSIQDNDEEKENEDKKGKPNEESCVTYLASLAISMTLSSAVSAGRDMLLYGVAFRTSVSERTITLPTETHTETLHY